MLMVVPTNIVGTTVSNRFAITFMIITGIEENNGSIYKDSSANVPQIFLLLTHLLYGFLSFYMLVH